MDEEQLRRDTLGFLRGSLSFRNRSISFHKVFIGKVRGYSGCFPFQHLAIISNNVCFFLKYTAEDVTFQTILLDTVEEIEMKEIGFTMFEANEILFAANYILKRMRFDRINRVLELLLLTICDSLEDLEPLTGEDFIQKPGRIAYSEPLPKKSYCNII